MKIESKDLMPHVIEALKEHKEVTFKVSGHSMWPFYHHQKTSVTLIQGLYKKHDVVLAIYRDRYVLHRIIKIKDDSIILQGDGAIRKEHILTKDIFGKVLSFTNKRTVFELNKWYRIKVVLWRILPGRRLWLRMRKK